MQFLQVEGLGKSFGGLKAIHGLGFEVEEGEILGPHALFRAAWHEG
jgi:ABC-type branched-subunit amino acid transport system ATPase component